MTVKHFKNLESYEKSEAFQHIHGVAPKHGPYPTILIAGKVHHVNHKKR